MLERIPPDDEAEVVPEESRFVDKSSSPLRDEAFAFVAEETGGAGGLVSLFRFFPNFFFVVVSVDCCCVVVDFVIELIGCFVVCLAC